MPSWELSTLFVPEVLRSAMDQQGAKMRAGTLRREGCAECQGLSQPGEREKIWTARQWKKDFERGQEVGKGAGMVWRLREEEQKEELRRNMRKRRLERCRKDGVGKVRA